MRGRLLALFLFIFVWIIGIQTACALEIIYPKVNYVQINAPSTFFLGNTEPDAKLTINDVPVKVYENGSFVQVMELKEGDNRFFIRSTINNKTDELVYIVNKLPETGNKSKDYVEEFPKGEYLYSMIIEDLTPLREKPNDNAKRLTHLNQEVILLLTGKQNDYYSVFLNSSQKAWVKSSNVVNYTKIKQNSLGEISNIKITEDKKYKYLKLELNLPLPYKITEVDKSKLELELYNLKTDILNKKNLPSSEEMKQLSFNYQLADNTLYLQIEPFLNKLWGYEAYYEGNDLVIKIRKEPKINPQKPLENITITIDAGHGGSEYGSVGPTGVKEKDINLDISKKLEKELTQQGAKVIMTRSDDSFVDLSARVNIAKANEALFLVSIHANALSDGANPLQKHGTSTFYYNKQAKNLAVDIKKELISALQTKDDETCASSFVLTRPTMPVSVLVEVAYMIHPQEYTLLLDDKFRLKAAKAISNAISKYLTEE